MDGRPSSSSRCRRGPVFTEVVYDPNKRHGDIPFSFTSVYAAELDQYVKIVGPDGIQFRVWLTITETGGKLAKRGWHQMIDFYQPRANSILKLQYVGESWFRMSLADEDMNPSVDSDEESDEETDDETSVESDDGPIGEYGEESDYSFITVDGIAHWRVTITLRPYTVSHNNQNLPSTFAAICLNLRKNYVTLLVDGGREFRCGFYVNKKKLAMGRYVTKITSGWKDVCHIMNFNAGDCLVLKVLNTEENVIHVRKHCG